MYIYGTVHEDELKILKKCEVFVNNIEIFTTFA